MEPINYDAIKAKKIKEMMDKIKSSGKKGLRQ
jgi:hypothetical protein